MHSSYTRWEINYLQKLHPSTKNSACAVYSSEELYVVFLARSFEARSPCITFASSEEGALPATSGTAAVSNLYYFICILSHHCSPDWYNFRLSVFSYANTALAFTTHFSNYHYHSYLWLKRYSSRIVHRKINIHWKHLQKTLNPVKREGDKTATFMEDGHNSYPREAIPMMKPHHSLPSAQSWSTHPTAEEVRISDILCIKPPKNKKQHLKQHWEGHVDLLNHPSG